MRGLRNGGAKYAAGAGKANDGEAANAAESQVLRKNLASSATGEKLREQPM